MDDVVGRLNSRQQLSDSPHQLAAIRARAAEFGRLLALPVGDRAELLVAAVYSAVDVPTLLAMVDDPNFIPR